MEDGLFEEVLKGVVGKVGGEEKIGVLMGGEEEKKREKGRGMEGKVGLVKLLDGLGSCDE